MIYSTGDIIRWCWKSQKQQTTPYLRVMGICDVWYDVIELDTGKCTDYTWEIVGASDGYWKKCLTPSYFPARVPRMDNEKPEAGDIWRWDDEWTVLLLKELSDGSFLGIALEDGWQGKWEFNALFSQWEKIV